MNYGFFCMRVVQRP